MAEMNVLINEYVLRYNLATKQILKETKHTGH